MCCSCTAGLCQQMVSKLSSPVYAQCWPRTDGCLSSCICCLTQQTVLLHSFYLSLRRAHMALTAVVTYVRCCASSAVESAARQIHAMPPSAAATSQSVSLPSRCLSSAERVLNWCMHLQQQLPANALLTWFSLLAVKQHCRGQSHGLGQQRHILSTFQQQNFWRHPCTYTGFTQACAAADAHAPPPSARMQDRAAKISNMQATELPVTTPPGPEGIQAGRQYRQALVSACI